MEHTFKEFKKLVAGASTVSFSVQITADDEMQVFLTKRQFLFQLKNVYEFDFVFINSIGTVAGFKPETRYDIVVDRFGNQKVKHDQLYS